MGKKLLVLDLDETLIHYPMAPLAQTADYSFLHFNIHFRPHLAKFIAGVLPLFDVGLWTASDEIYALPIVDQIFPEGALRFLWSRDRCTFVKSLQYHGCYDVRKRIKKVKCLGYRLESVVVVDDKPESYESYGNLVTVKPYYGSPADDELPLLLEYLKLLKDVPDIRAVDKRDWRRQVSHKAGEGS